MKTWTVTVLEDPADPEGAILPFPEDLLEEAGWKEGDTLSWIDNKDGSWSIAKVTKSGDTNVSK